MHLLSFLAVAVHVALGVVAKAPYKRQFPANGTVYTTEVYTEYTTFCPSPTTLVVNNATYTITEASTLTVTDCPCTIIKAVDPTRVVDPTKAVVPTAAGGGRSTATAVLTETNFTPVPTAPGVIDTGAAAGRVVVGGVGALAAFLSVFAAGFWV